MKIGIRSLSFLILLVTVAFQAPRAQLRTLDFLKRITEEADPELNIFLNRERVKRFKSRITAAEDRIEKMSFRVHLAWELFRAGNTQEAIQEVLDIREAIRPWSVPEKAPVMKSLRELLALCYLRLGEQQNCIAHQTADSCLIPLRGSGIHRIQTGARQAMQEFTALLQTYPKDLSYRWLLNLSYMAVGEYPDQVPKKWLIPPAVFESDDDIGRFYDIAPSLGVAVNDLAGGSILEDFDGDGTFSDWTAKAGLEGQWGGLNILQADYNNDGYPDVLVLRGGWLGYLGAGQGNHPNSLLRNNGDGSFSDVSMQSGILSFHPTQTAAWADYDLDGWLDLFIGNESTKEDIHPCELFRNNGDGTFTEVAKELGLNHVGFVKGVTWGDFDNDGFPDLYISRFGQSNLLYRNSGPAKKGWCFSDVTSQAGVGEPVLSFPTWFWDYDNDGWQDILAASFSSYSESTLETIVADYLKLSKAEHSRLYRNNRNGTFSDVTRKVKLDAVLMAMGANFGDLDNDGDQDIYAVFGGAFSGDTFRNALFQNPGHRNHWITLRLEGVRSNRLAVGARIKIIVDTDRGERAIYTTVGTGGSFGASSLQQEIGLGQATAIRSIEIRWPIRDGVVQLLREVPMDRIVVVREGRSEFTVLETRPVNDVLLALALAKTVMGQSAGESSLADQLRQADVLIEEGKLDESLALLNGLERNHPESPEVLVRIGEAYFRKQEHFLALAPLRKALELEPGHKRATQYLGSSLYFLGRLEEAIPYLEQSLSWFPDNVNFLNILGLCYIQTKKPDQARDVFSRIFDISSDSAEAHLITGQLLRQQDIWSHAQEELNRALELNPRMPMAHLYLGEIFLARRRLQEAMVEFEKEIEINPGMWMAYYRTGEVLFEMGKPGEAVPYLQRAIWLNKFFAGPYLLLGQIHLRANRLDLALENLELAVQYDYTNPNAHYLLGRALSQAGRPEEAQREFDLSKQFR